MSAPWRRATWGCPVADQLVTELVKVVPALSVAVTTLALGWFVGNRVTARWDLRKKHRELVLANIEEFYRLYGEFFATWKLWANLGKERGELRRELLQRAAVSEGRLEALLVKLSVECRLSDVDRDLIGCFRQAYQCLRESIRDDSLLRTGGQERAYWDHGEAPPYLAFKALAVHVASTLVNDDWRTADQAGFASLRVITDNRFESTWVQQTYHHLGIAAHPQEAGLPEAY